MVQRRTGGIGGIHCGSFVEREIKSPPQQQIVGAIAAPAGSSDIRCAKKLPAAILIHAPKANGSLNSSLSEEWRTTGPFPVLVEGDLLQDYLPARTTQQTRINHQGGRPNAKASAFGFSVSRRINVGRCVSKDTADPDCPSSRSSLKRQRSQLLEPWCPLETRDTRLPSK